MGQRRARAAFSITLTAVAVMLAGCAGGDGIPGQASNVRPSASHDPAVATAAERPSFALPAGVILVGLDASRIDDLFGRPEMVMVAGRAQWWRYAMGRCAIDVFLMRDGRTDDLVVSQVGVRPVAGTSRLGGEPCPALDADADRSAAVELDLPAVQLH